MSSPDQSIHQSGCVVGNVPLDETTHTVCSQKEFVHKKGWHEALFFIL